VEDGGVNTLLVKRFIFLAFFELATFALIIQVSLYNILRDEMTFIYKTFIFIILLFFCYTIIRRGFVSSILAATYVFFAIYNLNHITKFIDILLANTTFLECEAIILSNERYTICHIDTNNFALSLPNYNFVLLGASKEYIDIYDRIKIKKFTSCPAGPYFEFFKLRSSLHITAICMPAEER
jgi:hypothetical protein